MPTEIVVPWQGVQPAAVGTWNMQCMRKVMLGRLMYECLCQRSCNNLTPEVDQTKQIVYLAFPNLIAGTSRR